MLQVFFSVIIDSFNSHLIPTSTQINLYTCTRRQSLKLISVPTSEDSHSNQSLYLHKKTVTQINLFAYTRKQLLKSFSIPTQDIVKMSNSWLKTQLPNPCSAKKTKLDHNWGTQSTPYHSYRSNPPHYNRCSKPSTPRPSRRVTKLTQVIGSCAQGYKSSIREMSREVAMMQTQLASFMEMLQSFHSAEEKVDQKRDVDEMDWEFEDTLFLDNRKM